MLKSDNKSLLALNTYLERGRETEKGGAVGQKKNIYIYNTSKNSVHIVQVNSSSAQLTDQERKERKKKTTSVDTYTINPYFKGKTKLNDHWVSMITDPVALKAMFSSP